MMTLAKCPLCGSRDTEIHGGVVYCEGEYCYLRAASLQEWNDLARLIETGRLVEAMPEYHGLNNHPVADDPPWFVRNENCADAEGKTPLAALRKAAKAGKWLKR